MFAGYKHHALREAKMTGFCVQVAGFALTRLMAKWGGKALGVRSTVTGGSSCVTKADNTSFQKLPSKACS